MNIIQIRDRLKGVADSDLVNYVKNPTADVPSFVALSEIKRRKDDRDAYQARANETKKTVSEELTNPTDPRGLRSMGQAQATPPQIGVGSPQPQANINPAMLAQSGVGSLNPGNMRKMAEGGIIGFDGETGSLVRGSRNRFLGAELGFEDGPVGYPLGTAIGDSVGYLNPYSYLSSYNPRYDESGQLITGVGDRFADTKAELERRNLEKQKILDADDFRKSGVDITEEDVRNFADQREVENKKALEEVTIGDEIDYTGTGQPVTANVNTALLSEKLKDDVPEGEGLAEIIAKNTLEEKTIKQPGGGIKDIVTDKVQDTEIFNKFGEMRDRNQVPTEEAAIESLAKLRKAAGLEDDPFALERTDLRKDREALKDEKLNAGNMALISAGLLWARDGKISDAEPAVRKYAADLKGLRGEDRDLKKMDIQLKGATVAMKQNDVKSAGTLIAAAKKSLDAIDITELNAQQKTLHKQIDNNLKLQIANLNKDVTLESAKISASRKTAPEVSLAAAMKDPAFYKEGADGEKVFDYGKFAAASRSTMYPEQKIEIKQAEEYGQIINKLILERTTEELEAFKKQYPTPASLFGEETNVAANQFGQPRVRTTKD